MAIEIVIALLLVAANGFFVATEFSLARLRPTQVAEFERDRVPGSKSVRHAMDRIDAYLAACQLGITLASLGLGAIGEPAFHDLLEPVLGDSARIGSVGLASVVAFAIITLLHVVVGELSPKSLAISRTNRTALFVSPPMRLFYLTTKPLVDGFNALGNLLLKPFGIPPAREAGHVPHSEDELRDLLRQSRREGLIRAEELSFGENVFLFGDRRVREAMTPRPQVTFVHADDGPADVAHRALETGYTRLPVCEHEGGLDAAAGVVHVKDLLSALVRSTPPQLRDILRPLPRLPEGLRLDEALQTLRRETQHVALVVDEHGTAVGLLTLEDILEEIVGEIADEFDRAEPHEEVERDGDAFVVPGSLPIARLRELLHVDLDEAHEATIGGFVIETLGRVPDSGERVDLDGLAVEVVDSGDGRLRRLRVGQRPPGPEDDEDGDG